MARRTFLNSADEKVVHIRKNLTSLFKGAIAMDGATIFMLAFYFIVVGCGSLWILIRCLREKNGWTEGEN